MGQRTVQVLRRLFSAGVITGGPGGGGGGTNVVTFNGVAVTFNGVALTFGG
jgi:hypothetical protein